MHIGAPDDHQHRCVALVEGLVSCGVSLTRLTPCKHVELLQHSESTIIKKKKKIALLVDLVIALGRDLEF